jgi:hypothetical protein
LNFILTFSGKTDTYAVNDYKILQTIIFIILMFNLLNFSIMAENNEDGGYFSDILKEGLTDSEMSGWGRLWSIGVGLVGTVVADPVIWISEKLGAKEGGNVDPSDPSDPMNTNY